jgi:hypothetical protein
MNDTEEYTSIEAMLGQIKEGESMVAVWPAKNEETGEVKGYYVFIGDNWAQHGWAITQSELDRLHELTKTYYKKDN